MNAKARTVSAILSTGVWVNASEFLRNEVLLKGVWQRHYQSLGQSFPDRPLNAAVWVAWGFLFAAAVYGLSRRMSLAETAFAAWFLGFVLMWMVTWNLGVLPPSILGAAVPLSALEATVAAYLAKRLAPAS